MESLKTLASNTGFYDLVLPSGTGVHIKALTVQFPTASPPKLPSGILRETYTSKPLVKVGEESLFGELAVLRWLQKDGWDGVWVDTFHGKKFWKGMPHLEGHYDLRKEPHAKRLYDLIVRTNGKAGGFFDVMAWKDGRFLFVEYKGGGDRPNKNELAWIDAAIKTGVSEDRLLFVECARRSSR